MQVAKWADTHSIECFSCFRSNRDWDLPVTSKHASTQVQACYPVVHSWKQPAVANYGHPSQLRGPLENCSHSSQVWLVQHLPCFLGSLSGISSAKHNKTQYCLTSWLQFANFRLSCRREVFLYINCTCVVHCVLKTKL